MTPIRALGADREVEPAAGDRAQQGGQTDRQRQCHHGHGFLQRDAPPRERQRGDQAEGAVFVLAGQAGRAVADGEQQDDERNEVRV